MMNVETNLTTANNLAVSYPPSLFRLQQSIRHFTDVLQQHNIKVAAENTSAPRDFSHLSEDKQLDIEKTFEEYKQLIIRAIDHNVDIRNEVELLKFVSKDLHIDIDSNTFTYIKPQHIIEIYNLEFKQIYRSLNFLSFCGYDLFELLTYEFYQLYERSTHINEYLINACIGLKDRPENHVEDLGHIPTHLMREKFSANLTHSLIRFKHLSLLKTTSGKPFGYMITQRIKQIKEPSLKSIRFI